MSGFAVVYERSNTPVDPGVLERVMERLSHRGPDGRDCWISGPIAMGHWHFWITPEEDEEQQPSKFLDLPYVIVLDGRLDNRKEIIGRLKINPAEAMCMPDSALILQAYSRWGCKSFEILIGEFVFVIWDQQLNEVICVRDALGDRTLFYAFEGERLVIASEPRAVVEGLNQTIELVEKAIAYHFALQFPVDGQTFFKGVFELMPAQWLKVNSGSEIQNTFWKPNLERNHRKRSVSELEEEFRNLVEESICCRLRSITQPGVMMSGGLDSTSIACLTAKMVAPAQLTTISYVFDKFPECDERVYINAVKDQYGIRSIQIPCDDLWPFKDWQNWPMDPNWPPANPYRLVLERTYSRTQAEGIKVLLSGMFGDNLYWRSVFWLVDLIVDRCYRQFFCEMEYLFKRIGFWKTIFSSFLWFSTKELVKTKPGMKYLQRKPGRPSWLTSYGSQLFTPDSRIISENRNALVSLRDAGGISHEVYHTSNSSIEIRSPFRDRRIIEFFLELPGYLLYSEGTTRKILKSSLKDTLPPIIQQRNNKTNLLAFYNFGIAQIKNDILHQFIQDNTVWKKFVNQEVVIEELHKEITPLNDGPKSTLVTLCFLFEQWYKNALLSK